ncbi:hypothetical protein HU752_022370 [Pseudomonas vanderleydeniana]|uniref:Secreted protein n=1 Tax=Pseudomonas vanderleydeniana TaxID=2745495 RepID=A0A9E6PSD3_9PSED|nr:hypothetical protein HU752_022370 [Pseudomonas vanderleydeniana]
MLSSLLGAAVLFSGPAASAGTSLNDYIACDQHSLAVIEQPLFNGLIPTKSENGFTRPVGGTKSELGRRWMFDKPVTLDGVSLTGFYAEDMDMLGSRLISWGFYTEQAPKEVFEVLEKHQRTGATDAGGMYARAEIWSHSQRAWQPEDPQSNSGKLVIDTAERVFLIEPASEDLVKNSPNSKGMLTCSIQGNVIEAMLVDSRPDLIRHAP